MRVRSRCAGSQLTTPIISIIITHQSLGSYVVNEEAVDFQLFLLGALWVDVGQHYKDCLGIPVLTGQIQHILLYRLYGENERQRLLLGLAVFLVVQAGAVIVSRAGGDLPDTVNYPGDGLGLETLLARSHWSQLIKGWWRLYSSRAVGGRQIIKGWRRVQ